MKLIEYIPIGKQNKETREVLMSKAKITNVRAFRKELAKLKDQYIIINDNGYYLPANKKEYEEFIEKQNERYFEIRKTIDLAYKEMKMLDEE